MHTLRVLIIEDEPVIRWFTRDLLEEVGCECGEAVGAAEALAILEAGDWVPDLWLTDYNLGPGMTGDVLADEALRHLPGLPIVFITGNPECIAHRQLGPNERIMAKPFASDDLLAAVLDVSATKSTVFGPVDLDAA